MPNCPFSQTFVASVAQSQLWRSPSLVSTTGIISIHRLIYFSVTTSSISGYPTYSPSSSPTFTCPNCFFGATSATLHSFPYTAVATITKHVYPIVSIYPNGTTCTDYSISTNFPTITDPHLLNGPTFTDKSQMTWTVSNYSMSVCLKPVCASPSNK